MTTAARGHHYAKAGKLDHHWRCGVGGSRAPAEGPAKAPATAPAKSIGALIQAGHPGPSLAITALITLLAAEAAKHGTGPVLLAPAVLAGQLSIGWSNDAFDAERDSLAGRKDKPIAAGNTSKQAVRIAAAAALAASVILTFAIGEVTGILNVVMMAAGWAYNAGLKSTLASGLMYLTGFGLIPEFAASTLPGHPAARAWTTAAAAAVGLGAHFANVIPDLAGDEAAGVRGLPQRLASRSGPLAVRLTALALLLLASGFLVLDSSPSRRWVAIAGLGLAAVLAVIGARAPGRLPFFAAIGIAAIDVALFAFGGVVLV